MTERLIRLGHSPDPDDAFMFYGLASGKVDPGPYRFEHVLQDIQTLNEWALEGRLEVTALSVHAYAYVTDRYALLPHGASMGDSYGPMVVAREALSQERLRETTIAIPGRLTTAFLALRVCLGEFPFVEMPFDRILPAVAEGRVEAGLLIHEGQLTYGQHGLRRVVDLGEWWHETTGLPLPLGANAVRRDLGDATVRDLSRLLKASIRYGLEHRQEALAHALQFGRGLDLAAADRFVGMYVNDYTLDFGKSGRRAVDVLLQMGWEEGVLPHRPAVRFAEP
ncbi:MAG: ABC transporter substrate-binding protein [candidate division NC10 bacterium]|nr:ABC transporter substrate-binding protein [candidate division NC10 bacterium]